FVVFSVLSDLIFFFFSSRRRHTRFKCDWSSDVCSSDLCWLGRVFPRGAGVRSRRPVGRPGPASSALASRRQPPARSARQLLRVEIGRASCREGVWWGWGGGVVGKWRKGRVRGHANRDRC